VSQHLHRNDLPVGARKRLDVVDADGFDAQ
jgi:hypothetical protein